MPYVCALQLQVKETQKVLTAKLNHSKVQIWYLGRTSCSLSKVVITFINWKWLTYHTAFSYKVIKSITQTIYTISWISSVTGTTITSICVSACCIIMTNIWLCCTLVNICVRINKKRVRESKSIIVFIFLWIERRKNMQTSTGNVQRGMYRFVFTEKKPPRFNLTKAKLNPF